MRLLKQKSVSKLRWIPVALFLAVGTSGCTGLDLALCCLSCATGGIISAPLDPTKDQREQSPTFNAQMDVIKASAVRY